MRVEYNPEQHNSYEWKRVLLIITGVLVIIAFVLGYVLYSPDKTSPNAYTGESKSELSEAERQYLLTFTPREDTPREEAYKHAMLVKAAAFEAEAVEINACHADPLVLYTKVGATVTMENEWNTEIVLELGSAGSHAISPGESVNVTFTQDVLSNGPGIYAYSCLVNGERTRAGLLFVE